MEAVRTDPFLESSEVSRLPWLIVIFLTLLFFITSHNPLDIRVFHDDTYIQSQEEITSAIQGGTPQRRFGFLVLGLFGILTLWRRDRQRLRVNTMLAWTMMFFVLWAVASIFWTIDATLTLRRVLLLICFTLGATAAALHLSSRQFILFIALSTGLYVAVGFSAELLTGTFHPLDPAFRFAGTQHPNQEGIVCAMLLLSLCCLALMTERRCGLVLAGAALAFIFLILTKSRTALSGAVVALAVTWLLAASLPRRLLVAGNIILPVVLFLLFFGQDLLPSLWRSLFLGREMETADTLTGRTPLWNHCWWYIMQHPWLGYGYGAFWTPRHTADIITAQGWGVPEAHSAYLDLMLSNGLIMAGAFALMLILGITRAVRDYRNTLDPVFLFPVALLVFCAVDGALESAVVNPPSFLGFLMAVALIRLGFLADTPETQEVH